MNLLDILLVKERAKVELSINNDTSTKIIERDKLIEDVKKQIVQLTEDESPVEITFKEKEFNSSLRSEIVELIKNHFDYITLENHPNGFTFFCEEKDKMKENNKCYIRWDSKGIECILIRGRKFHSIQNFTIPIEKKDSLKGLKADEIHKSIMMFYGRPIEIEDLIKFENVGDKAATRFLSEISNSLIEVIRELNKLDQSQEYYISKVFPLFKNKEYVEKLNQVAQQRLNITFN